MPQLETQTYISQIFWLIVTFVPLYFILAKLALPRIRTTLEDRQNRIDQDLTRATLLSEEAEGVRAAYEQELTNARASAQEQVRKVNEAAAAAAAARHEGLSQELARDLGAAEERIAQARSHYVPVVLLNGLLALEVHVAPNVHNAILRKQVEEIPPQLLSHATPVLVSQPPDIFKITQPSAFGLESLDPLLQVFNVRHGMPSTGRELALSTCRRRR